MVAGSEKNKKGLFLFLYILIALCAVLFMIFGGKAEVKYARTGFLPLNHRITNSMSDLKETEKFDAEIRNFMRKWELNGASFALMKDDKLIYAKGYGYANVEDQEPCDVKHLFRIASVSKLITATAILKLHETGKLKLSDKVFGEEGILNDSKFLDIKDKKTQDITVEHLLRHQSGLSNRGGDAAFLRIIAARTLETTLPVDLDQMVEYATKKRLKGRPGAVSEYSNLGYIILSKVIEKVSGMDYETYVKENVLKAAGCYDMFIAENLRSKRRSNEVCYYEERGAEEIDSYDGSDRKCPKCDGGNDVAGLLGAGGWIASPVELLRLVAAIDDYPGKQEILSSESISKMTRHSGKTKPIGWATTTSNSLWTRTGTFAGTSSYIKKQPNGYTWVFITNTSSWKGFRLSNHISSVVTSAISKVKQWPERDLFTEV